MQKIDEGQLDTVIATVITEYSADAENECVRGDGETDPTCRGCETKDYSSLGVYGHQRQHHDVARGIEVLALLTSPNNNILLSADVRRAADAKLLELINSL